MAKKKAPGSKKGGPRGPYKKKSGKKSISEITNQGRGEIARILKTFTFTPVGKDAKPYDAILLMDSPTDQSKHATLSLSLAPLFKKNEEMAYTTIALGYDGKQYSRGGHSKAELVAVFDSTAHEGVNAPIKASGKHVHSRRHISTIMRILRIKLPERGQRREVFLSFEHIGETVYRITELKDHAHETQPVQTGE